MSVRIYCDIEGLEDNWIEVSDKWTRREFRAYLDSSGDEVWDWWRKKVIACHLITEDEQELCDPAEIDEDVLDDLDLRLVGFVGVAMIQACSHLRNLGNAHARASSSGSAATQTPAPPRPTS